MNKLWNTIWRAREQWPGWLGLLFALMWLALQVIPDRAAGVTGNDPSTYVQMAYDLAERGTVLHRFEGMREADAAGVHPALLAPAGYLPRNDEDLTLAAPLYPIGWPLLLALAYRLGGDTALFWVLPLMALLSAGLAWWVMRGLLLEAFSPGVASAGAAWALALLLTVLEQIAFSLSPMSDLPAQTLGLLAIALAIAAARRQSLWLSMLVGLTLGYGYLIRHAVLLMLAPVGWIVWRGISGRRRAFALAGIGMAMALFVLPDLLYHQRVLGAVFEAESPDSLTFSMSTIGPTLWSLIKRPESFGWQFWPFWLGLLLLLALAKLRSLAVTLFLWVGLLVGLHAGLTFTAQFGNVVRYNLPALPGVALIAALPLVAVSGWLANKGKQQIRWVVYLLLGLVGPILLLSGRPDYHYTAYGFLDADSRATYSALADTLPDNAIVLTDDQQAGAIAMYSGLAVARAQYWPPEEFESFLEAMRRAGRPVVTLGTPSDSLDFLWDYSPQASGIRLARPPDGGDGMVHYIP